MGNIINTGTKNNSGNDSRNDSRNNSRDNSRNSFGNSSEYNSMTWDGPVFNCKKNGYGIESDLKTNVKAYGEYVLGRRIGSWEFSNNGMVQHIHEYDRNGKLLKIINCRTNEKKQLYPPTD